MKKIIIGWTAIAFLWVLFMSSTYAAGGYGQNANSLAGTNTGSTTFVDENNDWVCDNYVNRPMDWTWKAQWRGQWNAQWDRKMDWTWNWNWNWRNR